MKNKKQISTTGANVITLTGVAAMLAIAGFSLPVNGIIFGGTALGCYHLSKKKKEVNKISVAKLLLKRK